MKPTESRTDQQALFDVVLYLVNSAPTSLGETPSLAAFRMLDAASRLLALMHPDDQAQEAFLATAKVEYETHFSLVMTDQQAFQQWLPDYVRICTEEAMRRMDEDTCNTAYSGPNPDKQHHLTPRSRP